MGRGGVDPRYFLHDMQMWEAMLYLEGMQMRDRSVYDAMRILAANVLSGIGAKKQGGGSLQPGDIYRFPEEAEAAPERAEEDEDKKKARLVAFLGKVHEQNRKAQGDGKQVKK